MRQFDYDSPALHSTRPRRDLGHAPSEPAIVAFAAFSLLGAIGMSYYCGIGLSTAGSTLKPAAEVPVYDAKAVPGDHASGRAGAVLERSLGENAATESADEHLNEQPTRAADVEKTSASHEPSSASQDAPLYSFPDLDLMQHTRALGTASGVAASVSSQYASADIEAPDAAFGSVAPVPEPAAWSFVGAFALLLCARERFRRRAARAS